MEKLLKNGYIHYKEIIDHKTIDDLVNKINIERKNLSDYGCDDKYNNLGNRI